MKIIEVFSKKTNIPAVADWIIQVLREEDQAFIQAKGAEAVDQAVNATIFAQNSLAEEGVFINITPAWVAVSNNEELGKTVRFALTRSLTAPPELFEEMTPSELSTSPPLANETALDYLAANADEDAVRDQAGSFTQNEEISADFAERQGLAYSGRKKLLEKLDTHHAESPTLAGGDIDAAWDQSEVGEETVGGMNPTPDQDVVDEIGAAAGLTYEDDEPLNTAEKLQRRDEERWELDPDSAETEDDPQI